MYCPRCGQPQTVGETRFCSACGFQLHGVLTLLNANGQLPEAVAAEGISPRKHGVRQGAKLFGAGILLVPILGLIHELSGLPEEIVGIVAVICFLGGLLRMLYAALFEEGKKSTTLKSVTLPAPPLVVAPTHTPIGRPLFANQMPPVSALPPATAQPAQPFYQRRNPLDTQEIFVQPPSVTDSTTRRLPHQE